ncbi:MAG: methionyl-tRNA formyltransferase [Bacteroidia bacterium]|jgi:methionyl-tRNA formyltransferase|nr:methionyl-tRNA formyltransferase [Bacteroidia bacterium]
MERLNKPRIVFLGTPTFAVASLDALLKAGYHIVAVVTAPDKPAGRGLQLQASAVKQYAVANNIPVLQPTNLKNESFLHELKSFEADLQVVIAFRMLPEVVWNMPTLGTINLHASLLPDYRGAAPINWVIMNGEKESGVSTFKLKHEIDRGDLLLQERVAIKDGMTAGELHDVLMDLGARIVVQTVSGVIETSISPTPQASFSTKIAPKISTSTCQIDWEKSGTVIRQQILGLSPYPGAISKLNNKIIKIFDCSFSPKHHENKAGDITTDYKNQLGYYCSDGVVYLKEIQLEGKKRMFVSDFLKGYRPI